jgi:hypothetical protein
VVLAAVFSAAEAKTGSATYTAGTAGAAGTAGTAGAAGTDLDTSLRIAESDLYADGMDASQSALARRTPVPLADRVAAWLILPALIPFLFGLAACWWFLEHGDDGLVVVEVGSGPLAFALCIEVWIAFASALSTAAVLLGRPSVYWHRAIPAWRVAPFLFASGVAALLGILVVNQWYSLLYVAAILVLPLACTAAFAVAVRLPFHRAPEVVVVTMGKAARIISVSFAAIAIASIAALEVARAFGEEATIAAYTTAAGLGLPWSLALFPFAYLSSGCLDGRVLFDLVVIVGVAINATVLVALATSRRAQARLIPWFFRLGPRDAE